jgi:hypothetical protein
LRLVFSNIFKRAYTHIKPKIQIVVLQSGFQYSAHFQELFRRDKAKP